MPTSPRFLVTAASGQLGRLVVGHLARQAGPEAVAAVVRDPARAAGLFPDGVAVRQGDYERPETLDAAFAGAERLLLISSNALGSRVAQHRNAIDAALRAGVRRIAYTSVLHADTSPLGVAVEHRHTEALIVQSGLPHSLLRNGWYTENHAAGIPAALQHGVLAGGAGDGRISSAARADYAEAAAAALLADEGGRVVHELAGDEGFTLAEFAAELSRQAGREIRYADMPEDEYRALLLGAGLPGPLAALIADSDARAAGGALFDGSRTLSRLIGRPTTPFRDTVAATLEKAKAA